MRFAFVLSTTSPKPPQPPKRRGVLGSYPITHNLPYIVDRPRVLKRPTIAAEGKVAIEVDDRAVASFWKSEQTVKPDVETYRAVLPGLATIPDSMLVAISSPYRKAGLMYEKFKAHYGRDSDDVLVVQATSRQLNPTLDASLVEQALEDDPAAARAEWLGEWRNDLASFIDIELIESCIDRGVLVRPPKLGIRYVAFVDAASGTGQDAFAVGIAHQDRDEIILDLVIPCACRGA
jgi:hypothetical protein